jgi:hypothetical protein
MRIISKFHDYYDSCMRHGIDMTCIYQRETKEFSHKNDFPISFEMNAPLMWKKPAEYKYWERVYDHGIVWFCGKVYPYVILQGGVTLVKEFPGIPPRMTHESVYCYTPEEAIETVMAHGSKEEKARLDLKRRGNRWGKKVATNREFIHRFFLDNAKHNEKETIETLCKLGVPVLWFEPSHPRLITNPCLKEIQFYKVFDPYAAYQELAMFVSGVMGGQAPPMVPVSDQIRLEKHGFDEWSFRKKVR